jgi:uncharacterized protein YndB with AHSA1/START domain
LLKIQQGLMMRIFAQVTHGGKLASKPIDLGEYVIEFSQQTHSSLDDIWGAFVKADKIAQWLTPVTGKLSKGGVFHLEDKLEGTITACEPKRRLGIDVQRNGKRQSLDIRFSETGKGKSKLRHIHVKITASQADLPLGSWQKYGPAAVAMGWELVLQSLIAFVETGKPVRAKGEILAYGASQSGRAFAANSFEGWRSAAMVGGTETMSGPAPSVLQVYSGLHP